MNKLLRFILVTTGFVLLVSAPVFADNQSGSQHRGFFFEVQIGPALTSYDAATDAAFASAEAMGLSRLRLGLGATLGFAVSPTIYLTGGVEGYGDRFYDSTGYIQLNTYLWVVGLRFYPFSNGLVLGARGGFATTSVVSDIGVSGYSSTPGSGFGVLVAYDFGGFTGMGFEIGARVDYCTINGSPFTGECAYVALDWK